MPEATVKKILQARVYEAAIETPISPAPFLSRRFNNQILIKREDLQPVYSFKIRGAYNKMAQLSEEQKNELSDACKIFTLFGEKVKIVDGELFNIKITTPYDLKIAQAIIQERISHD